MLYLLFLFLFNVEMLNLLFNDHVNSLRYVSQNFTKVNESFIKFILVFSCRY